MDGKILQLKQAHLAELFPNVFKNDLLKQGEDEKSFHTILEEQFLIEEALKKNKKQSNKSLFADSDSDEEFQNRLKNAIKQHRSNIKVNKPIKPVGRKKKEEGTTLSTSSCDEIKKITKPNSTQNKIHSNTPNPEVSLTNTESDIRISGSGTSDIEQLINLFFLKKDHTENINLKKHIDYEKQGAIPKRLDRENSNENSSGAKKNQHLQSKSKTRRKDQNRTHPEKICTKSKLTKDLDKDNIPENSSGGKVMKLSEEICSKPFFYIVPENPSQNFLFSRGSYYVIPKNSPSGEQVIVHPESSSTVNTEKIVSQPTSTGTLKIRNMNNLEKDIMENMDCHLNIGPRDVKLGDIYNNMEASHDLNKLHEKFPTKLSESLNIASELHAQQIDQESLAFIREQNELKRIQQLLMSEFPEIDSVSALRIAQNYFPEEDELQDYIKSRHFEKKIEDQFSKMLGALPDSNIEELRIICNAFKGDEELVNNYIKEVKLENKKRQQVVEMQIIFPDADPEYLSEEIEKLGGNTDAVNTLTVRLLDENDYPKILDDHVDAERQRLWRNYVNNFNVQNYIRNVPNPENFKVATGHADKKYKQLAMEFLQSRYPQESVQVLEQEFTKNEENVTKTCQSRALKDLSPVRLANSSFKNKDYDEAFLKEACYIDNKNVIKDYLKDLKELKEIEIEEARLNDMFLLCPLCCNDELVASDVVPCADGHIFCKDCVKRYVLVKLGDGVYKFSCPSEDCEAFFTLPTLEKLLPDKVLSNIVKKQQAAEITTAEVDGLESCPFCEFAYIPNPEDKIFKCQNPECLIETCRKCHEKNHIPLHCEEIERPQDIEARKKIEETMTEKLVRICPSCFKKFVKLDGCNKMTCPCGTIVCYYCRRKVNGYDHFSNGYESQGRCPLYSNNTDLHTRDVVQAGVAVRDQILRENPNIRILYDPVSLPNH